MCILGLLMWLTRFRMVRWERLVIPMAVLIVEHGIWDIGRRLAFPMRRYNWPMEMFIWDKPTTKPNDMDVENIFGTMMDESILVFGNPICDMDKGMYNVCLVSLTIVRLCEWWRVREMVESERNSSWMMELDCAWFMAHHAIVAFAYHWLENMPGLTEPCMKARLNMDNAKDTGTYHCLRCFAYVGCILITPSCHLVNTPTRMVRSMWESFIKASIKGTGTCDCWIDN